VAIAIGVGSFDFDFELSLLPGLSIWLSAHAAIPIPALDPTDAVSSVNALLDFDPSEAKFSIAAGVDLSKLMELMLGSVSACKDVLDKGLRYAQQAYDKAARFATQTANAALNAANKAGQQVMKALNQLDAINAGVDRMVEKAEFAVDMAKQGILSAGQAAERLMQKANVVVQKGIDAANRALSSVTRQFDQAIARAGKAIDDALDAVADFGRQIEETLDKLTSWLPFSQHRVMHTMAERQYDYKQRSERRAQRGLSMAASWNDFQPVTVESVSQMEHHIALAEATREVVQQQSDRRLLNFLDDILDGLYYMRDLALKMVRAQRREEK
jgi:hypothetical protein